MESLYVSYCGLVFHTKSWRNTRSGNIWLRHTFKNGKNLKMTIVKPLINRTSVQHSFLYQCISGLDLYNSWCLDIWDTTSIIPLLHLLSMLLSKVRVTFAISLLWSLQFSRNTMQWILHSFPWEGDVILPQNSQGIRNLHGVRTLSIMYSDGSGYSI